VRSYPQNTGYLAKPKSHACLTILPLWSVDLLLLCMKCRVGRNFCNKSFKSRQSTDSFLGGGQGVTAKMSSLLMFQCSCHKISSAADLMFSFFFPDFFVSFRHQIFWSEFGFVKGIARSESVECDTFWVTKDLRRAWKDMPNWRLSNFMTIWKKPKN